MTHSHTEKLIADGLWRDISEATEDDGVFLGITVGGEMKRAMVEYQVLVPSDYYDVAPTRCVIAIDEEYQPSAEATHFRPLPDDRLANALKVALEALGGVRSKAVQWEDWEYLGIIDQALAEIERIAKGE